MEDLVKTLANFGPAGLIACMWLAERRASATRERQLTEAHEGLFTERERTRALLDLVGAANRTMAALEASHRDLASGVRRLADALTTVRAAG